MLRRVDIPEDWTQHQAESVLAFLNALADAIWERYEPEHDDCQLPLPLGDHDEDEDIPF